MKIKPLEILIVEDYQKNLQDAKTTAAHFSNIHFTYARTLAEAKKLLEERTFDSAIADIFFPESEGMDPSSDSALKLRHLFEDKNLPYVHNTAGNHHGFDMLIFCYRAGLREPTQNEWNRSLPPSIQDTYPLDNLINQFNQARSAGNIPYRGLCSGNIIESFPDYILGAADKKQWTAAINYAILLANAPNMDEQCKMEVDSLLHFDPYGDYGLMTEKMEFILNPTTMEDKNPSGFRFIREVIAGYKCVQ
jgi:hypothetical protein